MARPRTKTPSPKKTKELGEELVKWAQEENKKDPHTRFSQFYALEKSIPRKTWKSIVLSVEFLPYYEKAQALLAKRCMDKNVMDKSFGHRFLRLYECDLIESENDGKKFEAELKKLSLDEAKELLIKIIDYSDPTVEKNGQAE